MKKALTRSLAVLIIIGLSLGIGFIYTSTYDKLEHRSYPLGFKNLVEKYSEKYGVPEIIIYSMIKVESDFQSNAVSSANAVGLMQITSDTCDWIAMKLGEKSEFALMYDPETNIRYGTYFISYLKLEYGNWDTAFAAYNAGHARVDRWLEDERYSDGNGVLKDIPIDETRNYVEKINEAKKIYSRLYPELDN